VLPDAASRFLLTSPLTVPVIGGLALIVTLAAVDCPGGQVPAAIDRVLAVGLEKYLHFDNVAGAASLPTAWKALPQMLAAAVWLSLSVVFLLRRSLVFAGTLVWIGGILSAAILLAGFRGWFVSPALPLVVTAAYAFLLSAFGGVVRRLQDGLRLERQAGFQQRILEVITTCVETRESERAGHIARMRNYVRILAECLARSGRHAAVLTPEYRQRLDLLCPLHDIGKAGIRDAILLKQGRLTEEEFGEMQRHVEYGENLLQGVEWMQDERELVHLAQEIIAGHHERWDGSGYPRGLAGDEIPLAGRIVAVADVYDALISRRCYKAAYTREQSRAIIMKGRGTAFDPDLADAFLAVEEELWKISLTHSDTIDSSEGARP
jgi:adenylate cyclase